ncbi:hypothetical protein AFLA_006478 [Aspergillus flavus NRRL3357]|nr:hypothetical protein AFLA_006478 [Aspergillus flavus NRRL3357]
MCDEPWLKFRFDLVPILNYSERSTELKSAWNAVVMRPAIWCLGYPEDNSIIKLCTPVVKLRIFYVPMYNASK